MARDIKFKTLLRKLNKELQGAELKNILWRYYPDAVLSVCQKFLDENHYPLTVDMDGRVELIFGVSDDMVLAKVRVLSSISRDHYYFTFKRIVCTGLWFDSKISEIIARRARGITWEGDASMYEIAQLGYDTAEDMLEAERRAQEIIDKCQFAAIRFRSLSQEEQDIILKERLTDKKQHK